MPMPARGLAVLSLGISVVGACLVSAQGATPPDPWTRVPATTSCYPDDGLENRIDTALAAVTADLERQKTANAELNEKLHASNRWNGPSACRSS